MSVVHPCKCQNWVDQTLVICVLDRYGEIESEKFSLRGEIWWVSDDIQDLSLESFIVHRVHWTHRVSPRKHLNCNKRFIELSLCLLWNSKNFAIYVQRNGLKTSLKKWWWTNLWDLLNEGEFFISLNKD